MKKALAFSALIAASSVVVAGEPAGLWTFDDGGNLGKATVGPDLTLAGTHSAAAGVNAGDGAILDPVGTANYLRLAHGIAPNGGGGYVNQWSLVMDIQVPAASFGNYVALYQTSTGNANDGDFFVSPSGTLGVGLTGYSVDTIAADTWYRVGVSVDNGNWYRIYVNGVKWLEGTPQALDGRFSLDPEVLFFADEDGEDNNVYCSTLALWGDNLTDADMTALGGPLTPILVPEPTATALIGLAGVIGLVRRYRK